MGFTPGLYRRENKHGSLGAPRMGPTSPCVQLPSSELSVWSGGVGEQRFVTLGRLLTSLTPPGEQGVCFRFAVDALAASPGPPSCPTCSTCSREPWVSTSAFPATAGVSATPSLEEQEADVFTKRSLSVDSKYTAPSPVAPVGTSPQFAAPQCPLLPCGEA